MFKLISIVSLLLVGCIASDPKDGEDNSAKPQYILKLGDVNIAVDSVNAEVWFEEQINNDVLTLKVYCASEYPIKDEEIIKVDDWMCIVAQCDAEKGRHYLGKSGGDWINELHYEFPKSSISGGSGIKSSITITAVDLENDLASCSFKLGEYINFKDALKGEKAKKSVLFKGKNIPFKRYPR